MESSNPSWIASFDQESSWIASFDQESVDQQLAASLLLKAQIRDDVDGEIVEKSDEFQLRFINRSEDEDKDEESEEAESDEEEEEEFSFASVGSDSSTVSSAGGFQDGEIRTTFFPLFDQSLLYAVDRNDLPHRPSVKKVFIETEDSFSLNPPPPLPLSSDSGPYCAWSRKAVEASSASSSPPSPQICKKSNSTGFCKLWRVQDLMKRSNSDGRDAYVFLNNGSSSKKQVSSAVGDAKTLALGRKVKKSSTKGKSAGMKAHEKYLRSKEEDKERRKTYLPYRPELMGFFTNIHGGLSRNVHPF